LGGYPRRIRLQDTTKPVCLPVSQTTTTLIGSKWTKEKRRRRKRRRRKRRRRKRRRILIKMRQGRVTKEGLERKKASYAYLNEGKAFSK